MDVSKKKRRSIYDPKEPALQITPASYGRESESLSVDKLSELTDIPKDEIEKELHELLKVTGSKPESFGIQELRKAMLHYLAIINEEMTEGETKPSPEESLH